MPSSASNYTNGSHTLDVKIFNNWDGIYGKGPSAAFRGNTFMFYYGKDGSNGGAYAVGGVESWQDGNWHQYALTWDASGALAQYNTDSGSHANLGSYLKLYRDGSAISTTYTNWSNGTWLDQDYEENNSTGNFRFGFPGDASHNHTNLIASYDEIAIWKKVLTSSQIDSIYNDGTASDVSSIESSDLKRYYRFEDSDGTDTAGNHTGTKGSSATFEDY